MNLCTYILIFSHARTRNEAFTAPSSTRETSWRDWPVLGDHQPPLRRGSQVGRLNGVTN